MTERELKRRLSGVDGRINDLEDGDGPRTYPLAVLLEARQSDSESEVRE